MTDNIDNRIKEIRSQMHWMEEELTVLLELLEKQKLEKENFILENKPCLSVSDILDILEADCAPSWKWNQTCRDSKDALKNAVKNKLEKELNL